MNVFIALLFFLISLFFRVKGIFVNHPFWVDEFATADQAKLLLQYGLGIFNNPRIYFEHHNITTHILVALFFQLFGFYEWVARMPFVIIGSLIPAFVYLLTKRLFNSTVAISAALLSTFSYYQITWSRQARGYILLQFLVLIGTYLYFKFLDVKKKSPVTFIFLFFTGILGILTHSFYFLFIGAIIIHFVIFYKKNFVSFVKSKLFFVLLLLIIVYAYFSGFWKTVVTIIESKSFYAVNNLWYYHSFLWREYILVTFLGLVGLVAFAITNRKRGLFILIYLFFHLMFISFVFAPYHSKYLVPIFSLLLIGMANSFSLFKLFKSNTLNSFLPIILTVAVILNGDKFTLKPKSFYSVNRDFREVALIDYHQVYDIIKSKIDNSNEKVALIETWNGRAYWYLGHDYQPLYILRWKNEKLTIQGMRISRTNFIFDKEGNKIIPRNSNLRLVEDIDDFKKVISKYPKGFIFIDDVTLPKDVLDFAKKNLKKELYLDHYPLDDNPYSIWPATLYSWGII